MLDEFIHLLVAIELIGGQVTEQSTNDGCV